VKRKGKKIRTRHATRSGGPQNKSPSGCFVWSCPGCEYNVDLMNPSPDILNQLPDNTKRVLGGKWWKVKEELIQRLLFQVVSNHYGDYHLSGASGVQASGNE